MERDQVQAQLNEWAQVLRDYQEKITAWKIKADKLDADARVSAQAKLENLEHKIEAVREKLDTARAQQDRAQQTRAEAWQEVKSGAGSAWDSLKSGVEQAWEEVKSTFDQSSSKPK